MKKLEVIFLVIILVLILAFFNREVRMEGIFFGADEVASDILHFSYPYREFWATDYLKKGEVPLWNQYIASGVPILAEAQTGIFYPVANLLYWFFTPPVAFNWLIISSYIITALGTYWYARKLGLSSPAAFFSTAVFTLSGFMVVRLRHVPIVTALTFMPWMFLAVEEILRGGRTIWVILLAFFVAFSLFAGHFTTTYLILLILAIYFLLRLGKIFKDQQKESLRPILLLILALLLAGGLASIQLLPSAELIKYSTRVGVSAEMQRIWGSSFDLKYLLFFVNPYLLGDPSQGSWDMQRENYWENMGYLGIIPLGLILLSFFKKSKNLKNLFTLKACLLISFLLTLGFLTPVYNLFSDFLPGFSLTRLSGRFLLFVDFFGAILAGFGLAMIVEKFTGRIKTVVMVIIIIFSIADLFYFGYPFNTVMPFSYFDPPKSVDFLKNDPDLFRILSFGETSWVEAWKKAHGWRGDLSAYLAQREVIPTDYNVNFGLSTTSIIYELAGHFSVKRSGEMDALVRSLINKPDRFVKLLSMENIKYLIETKELSQIPGMTLVYQHEIDPKGFTIYIYKNNYWIPRAYVVGKARNFPDEKTLERTLLMEDFDPQKEVYLEGGGEFPETNPSGEVVIEKYQDAKVSLQVKLLEDGFLVLSDTNYPGWQAYIDGKETKIYQANYAYRAVRVLAGEHTVVFKYEPISYKIGKGISLGSLGFLVLAGLLSLRRKNEPKRA